VPNAAGNPIGEKQIEVRIKPCIAFNVIFSEENPRAIKNIPGINNVTAIPTINERLILSAWLIGFVGIPTFTPAIKAKRIRHIPEIINPIFSSWSAQVNII
jgi:hypothetical protein